jgi:hypothetical protein
VIAVRHCLLLAATLGLGPTPIAQAAPAAIDARIATSLNGVAGWGVFSLFDHQRFAGTLVLGLGNLGLPEAPTVDRWFMICQASCTAEELSHIVLSRSGETWSMSGETRSRGSLSLRWIDPSRTEAATLFASWDGSAGSTHWNLEAVGDGIVRADPDSPVECSLGPLVGDGLLTMIEGRSNSLLTIRGEP